MSNKCWGGYPKIATKVHTANSSMELGKVLNQAKQFICYGNGRSYGDSALNNHIIGMKNYNYFLDFDSDTGILHVQAGVLLSEIIKVFVPKGWFLTVTPGTKLITIGGAIASDVHGKNHHIAGCFSESIVSFRLMLADTSIITCSKTENADYFYATCGGMGLTGIILDAKIHLQKINSQFIKQTTIKTANLKETFEVFECYADRPYSVAWIDCLAKDKHIGKSILNVGEFADDGNLSYQEKRKTNIPIYFPNFALNKITVKAFNWFYYRKAPSGISKQTVNIDTFFYPLDAINNWNRIYGKQGFLQYQFILPKKTSYTGIKEILDSIASSGKGSFLAVLKLYGKENHNWLSFPMEGYSLAIDFKIDKEIFDFLNHLDQIVVQHHGRIYLTKDARVSKQVFALGYPSIDKFRTFRRKHHMDKKFNSLQSQRLEL